MRVILTIDDVLIEPARKATRIQDNTALVRAGLEALLARVAGQSLASLGGTHPEMADIPRRRSD